MPVAIAGLVFAIGFVLIESAQFVFFGGIFQKVDSFWFSALVFGLTVIIMLGWSAITKAEEIRTALRHWRLLLAINLGAVATFTAFLQSVQLIEPAITYTISSGTMPITAWLLHIAGVREGEAMRNRTELIGNLLIFFSLILLAVITILGFSGFVRGGSSAAMLGVGLAMLDGIFFTLILVYSQRLDRIGIGPAAILGLRLPLYVIVTAFIASARWQDNQLPPASDLAIYVLVALLLTIPPLYFLQRAVRLLSTLTLSTITALGPLVIFLLQIIEGRVDYRIMTLAGLLCYFIGASIAAAGAVKAATKSRS